MEQFIHNFVNHLDEHSLYRREKARNIALVAMTAYPSMIMAIIIHIADQMPVHFIFADGICLVTASLALISVRKRRLNLAGSFTVFGLFSLVIIHNLVTDYVYETELTYYRILETTLLLTLISIIIPLFMQHGRLILIVSLLGSLCIFLHYFIITSKTGTNPWDTRPLSILIAYFVTYLIINVIAHQILKVFMRLLKAAEDESDKVKQYNRELEKMVQERTSSLEAQNRELKKVNSELDRFVYSASHDLRAPLTSLLGLIQLARVENNLENIRNYLDLQEKSIHKLDNFIQDIVNISKNTRTEIRQDEINFRELVEDILDQLDYMDHTRLVEKSIEIAQEAPFYSDQYRLGIVFNNLLSNAIRYAAPHRKNAYIKVHVEVSQNEALLNIEDNGRGIAEEHLEKIFEMFFRTDNDNVGSGLGLYIVKETLDKLGGQITVGSTLGKGTIFMIKIPSEVPCHSLSNA
jgi:signal transduction histidine kinase